MEQDFIRTVRLKKIEKQITRLHNIIRQKELKWDFDRPYKEYTEHIYSEQSKIENLDREMRMIMPYELSELPDYGDVMSLTEFVESVKNGCFIDYDGSGKYVKDDKETNITIYPSDIYFNSVRPGFDTIIWFNK